jgi:hypothetical protein
MVENGRLPSHDLYTFTVPEHVWTDHEYLTEIAMWLIFHWAGLAGIAVAFGIVTWLGFVLIYRTARGGSQPYIIAGLAVALAAAAGGPIWGPRAQMITFLFSCLELMWLAGYLQGRSRAINWFPLVMVLWANLHGGWVVGFGFLGVALLSEAVQLVLNRAEPAHRAHLKRLGLIFAASVLAVALTPHGVGLYTYPFQTQGSVAQQRLIVEWFSPDFHQTFLRPFEAMFLILFTGFVLRRPSLYEFLLSITVVLLALQSVRHVALFVAATTPILMTTWSAIWRDLAARRRWNTGGVETARPVMAVMVSLALLVIAGASALRVNQGFRQQNELIAGNFPVGASDYLAAHPEVGTRMYNQYGWGGYLAYRFYPEPNRKVFVFGEAALMGDELLNRYEDVQTLRTNWHKVLDEKQVDYVVYNRDEALSNVLVDDPHWKLVYQDKVAMIFVRSNE